MKHLQLKGQLYYNEAGKFFVKLSILSQTHLGEDFGNCGTLGDDAKRCFRHGRILLYSYPGIGLTQYFPNRRDKEMWLLVMPTTEGDFLIPTREFITVTLSEWAEIRAAVEAYNEWGKTQ